MKRTVAEIGLITGLIGLLAASIGLATALLTHQKAQNDQNAQQGDSSSKTTTPGDVPQQSSTEDSLDTPPNSRDSDSQERTSPDNLSPSSSGVDYSSLEGFLQRGQWEEADEETANLMLEVANREEEGWLDDDSLETFPCDVLGQIDRLWVDNSGGKFGFSVQKKIYIDCGGKPDGQYDEGAWLCFADAVGWRVEDLGYSQNLDTSAREGHLPSLQSSLPWLGEGVLLSCGVSKL